MDNSVITLFIGMAGFAGMSFYLGYVRPPKAFAHYAKASFIVFTFMLIPIAGFVLWGQHTAKDRLAGNGIVPHPDITHSVGLSSGMIGDGTWIFSADTTPDRVLAFYKAEKNRPGWELESETPIMLTFNRDGRSLIIGANREFISDPTMVIYKLGD